MNPNSEIGRMLHDELVRIQIEPGGSFNHVLRWCEDFIENELAFDPAFDDPRRAVRNAINQGRKQGWR